MTSSRVEFSSHLHKHSEHPICSEPCEGCAEAIPKFITVDYTLKSGALTGPFSGDIPETKQYDFDFIFPRIEIRGAEDLEQFDSDILNSLSG